MNLGLSNWIIIVSAVLMVGVVLHGISLRWRSRRNRLRIDIDRTLPREDVDDLDLLRAELPNGGARLAQPESLRGELRDERQAPPVLINPAGARARVTPKIDTDADETPVVTASADATRESESAAEAAPAHIAEPVQEREPARAGDLFGDDDSFPPSQDKRSARSWPKGRRDGGGKQRETKIASGVPADATVKGDTAVDPGPSALIVINVFCRDADGFSGDQIVQLVNRAGLKYGDMNIFHRMHSGPKRTVDYSMASAVEPGTFDLSTIKETRIRGVSFFLQLPGPSQPVEAFDDMHNVALTISQSMNGELKDEVLSVMTPQTIEHCRERIREFTRKYALRN